MKPYHQLQRFSFAQAALEIGCSTTDVRSLVVEEKRLNAVFVTLMGHTEPYGLQVIDVDDTGAVFDISKGYANPPRIGYLRIERDMLSAFLPPVTVPDRNSATPAPVAGKKWTPDMLACLATYRGAHTMPETAEKFGITEQRIRQLLPSQKNQSEAVHGLVHRIK